MFRVITGLDWRTYGPFVEHCVKHWGLFFILLRGRSNTVTWPKSQHYPARVTMLLRPRNISRYTNLYVHTNSMNMHFDTPSFE